MLLLLAAVETAQGQVLLKGHVVDAETQEPLAAAHVQLEGTARGTITNAEGRFELRVELLPVTLAFRYVGYQTQEIEVGPNDGTELAVALQPAVVPLDEIFVTGDDFAENIMRKVIAQKQKRRARLRSYEAEGYTKIVLRNDRRIVLLSESVFDVFWRRDRGPREIVRSWRKTADFYDRLAIAPAGNVPDLYADVVEIHGVDFFGPTHPDALKYYTFNLAQRRALDSLVVYDIYVAPRSFQYPTFIGRISIVDSLYMMIDAELRPARHVTYPLPVLKWDVSYQQQFSDAGDSVWMPVDLRMEGDIRVQQAGRAYRDAHLRQVSLLSDYATGVDVPDSLYAGGERVTVDRRSVLADVLFLRGRNMLPLTPREVEALETLRREPLTLEAAFRPEGQSLAVATFEAARYQDDAPQVTWPTVHGYSPWLWFNRVDGFAGGVMRYVVQEPHFRGRIAAAQVTGAAAPGMRRIRFLANGQYRWGRGGLFEAGSSFTTTPRGGSHLYAQPLNTLPAVLGWGDYFDWYWRRQAYARAGYRLPHVRLTAGLSVEEDQSIARSLTSVWPLDDSLRANPPIDDGTMQTLTLSVATGEGYLPIRMGPLNRAGIDVAYSPPWAPGNDFGFATFRLAADGYLPTFFRHRLHPNGLHVRAFAGSFAGHLPVQRLGVLDTGLGPFASLGAFRAARGQPYEGEQYAGVFWEHDFTTVPFELLGLRPLVVRRMGLAVFGAHGRTWFGAQRLRTLSFAPRVTDGWHHEVGASLTNVLGYPVRVDVAWRLDEPGVFIGFGLMELWGKGGRR